MPPVLGTIRPLPESSRRRFTEAGPFERTLDRRSRRLLIATLAKKNGSLTVSLFSVF